MTELSVTALILLIFGTILFSFYAIYSGKVNLSGAIAGVLIVWVIFYFIEWEGIIYFISFFLLGSFASKWKVKKKKEMGLAQENKGQRTHVHAISNTAAGAFYAALVHFIFKDQLLTTVSVASVFAAATSDTLSSEIGNITGSKYLNILSFREDQKGKDGVISPEGTLVGLIGSFIIASIHLLYHHHISSFLIITFAGFMANLLDSILGATLQRQKVLNNHTVNLSITFFSGALSIVFHTIIN